MEVGTEISQKIRSAIKAKLIELGAYVDDELPDYIMVMVANKKNQDQMISDLNLFLGKHTDVFAEWLHGLLGKLQTISVDTSAKTVKEKKKGDSKKEKVKKKGSKKSSKSENSTAKTKTVSITSQKNEATNDKSVEQTTETSSKSSKSKAIGNENQLEVEDVRQMLVTVAPTDELAAELETTEARIEQSKTATNRKTHSPEPNNDSSAAVSRKRSVSPESDRRRVQSSSVPKKHRGLTSVVANVRKGDKEEEEYDPLCPAVGSVASVVKVTSRKSRIPPALQANSVPMEQQSVGDDVDSDAEGVPVACTMIRLDDTASLSRIRDVLTDVLNQDKVDEISIFCRSIASSFRKMNQRNLAIAKLRIQKILFDYESSLQASPEKASGGNSSAQPNPISLELSDSAKSLSSDGNLDNPTLRDSQTDCMVFGPKGRPSNSLSSRLQFDSTSLVSLSSSSSKCENSVSSSRNDHPSPQHHHRHHSASTSKLSNCVDGKSAIDSSSLSFSKKSKHDTQPSSSNNKQPPSNQIISLESLHQKRHSELESSAKGSLLKVRPLLHNIQSAVVGGDGGENSGSDSPKPISAEQLKVLAKNLKITVTNSRALKSLSKWNSDDSSSGESEEGETSEEESEEEEKESATKDVQIPKEGDDPNIQQTTSIGEGSSEIEAVPKEVGMSEGPRPDTQPDG